MQDINVEEIVYELYPNPIRDDFGKDEGFDAREFLINSLRSYHEALCKVPDGARSIVARAFLDGLVLGKGELFDIWFKDQNIPEKYYKLVDFYNKRAEIPSLESYVRNQEDSED